MQLQEAIKIRLGSEFSIFDRQGNRVAPKVARREYAQIKFFLNDHRPARVAIKLEKDYPYLLSILACMELGIPYVPMKDNFPTARVEQIKEDAPFELLLDKEKLKTVLSQETREIEEAKQVSPEDTLYTIFTSGSTGRPKGVSIQRKAALNYFHWLCGEMDGVTENSRLLQVADFTFDMSFIDVCLFIYKNVELRFSQFEGNIFRLAYEIESYKINALSTVPNNLNMLLNDMVAQRTDLSSLETLMIGGARFSWGLYEKTLKRLRGRSVYNFYGPTECTIYTHSKKLSFDPALDTHDHNVSIGRPISNIEASLLEGELLLGGAQLMKEYINNPEKTSQVLVEREGKTLYKTGDLAYENERGECFITGRSDDTIKTRGYRVNLLDVDSYITTISCVQDACSVALANEDTENEINTFVILKEDKTEKEIKKELKAILLPYQVPEKLHFIKSFPTNKNGKVCKKQLKEML